MSTKKKNTNVDTKKKGAAEKSPSNSVYEGVIPGLSMVASSTSLAPSNNVKKTTGSIASTAKEGSTRKIEEAYEQRVASQMASPKTGRVPTNAQLVEAPKVDNYARNEEIISQYESIPSYNAFERLLDRDKKQAYDTKQTMYSSYSKALSENYGQALRNAGFTDEDLYNAFLPGYATEEAAKAGAKQYNEMMKHDTAAAQQFAQNYIPEEEGNRLSESLKKKIADAGIDVDRAQKYFQNWKDEQDAKDAADYGKEHKAESFVTTAVAKPVENILGAAANTYNYLSGNPIDLPTGLKETDIVRQGAQSDMGQIPGLLYGAGSSVADILTGLAIGGGGYSAANQGLAQANSVMNDASERGLTPNKILAEGIGSGVATGLTEMGALGKIQDIVGSAGGNFLTKTLASGSAEGLQEVFESLINSGIDQIIGGKNADLTQQYNAQIAAGSSKADAALNTAKNYAVSLIYDFLGGAIAGGALGAGGLAMNRLAGNGNSNNNQSVQHETTNTVLPGMGDTVEQLQDNVPQATAQRIEELAAQIQPGTETEVQGESAPRFNEPETLSIKPVDAPADYAFTLPEAEVNQIDMQMEARTAEIADIFVEPSFGAMEFTREDGSRYIASKSTRDGVEYQLSFIDSNGDPVSHSEYQSPVELAEAVNDLTWNKDYEYHVLNNSVVNPVDENADLGYSEGTENVTEGGPVYGNEEVREGYDGRGSETVRGGLGEGITQQSEGSANLPGGRGQLPFDSGISRSILENAPYSADEEARSQMMAAGSSYADFRDAGNNPDLYSQALAEAKKNNSHGGSVTERSADNIREIIENGGSAFLTPDATAGAIVEANGDLTGVFKNPVNPTKRMGSAIALMAVKNGAIKGDCFGKRLVNMYSAAGFEPVARMPYTFGIEGNEQMDNEVRAQLESGEINKAPDVYALKLRDGMTFDDILSGYNTAPKYSQAELDALPLYDDYDKMLNKRDRLIEEGKKKTTYLGAVPGEEISEEEMRRLEENGFIPEDDFEDETEEEPIDENQPLIENGQVTRNGVDFIRNRWKPEQKTLKDTPYNKQFLGIRQALTSNNMGKNDGSRQFSWAIASEIRQYLQDRDRTHLENAQIYADYIDNVIAPYEQGKAATITGAGGRTWTVEEGTQNISGRTAALIDQVIADENREVLNDLPEEIQAHIDALESMKDPVFHSSKFALDQLIEEYENAIIRMKVNHESPDGKTFDRITNLATNAGQIIKQQEKQLRNMGYDPEERFTEAYYLEHMYPLIDFFDQTHHEIYDSNLEVDVPVEEDVVPGMEQAQEVEAAPLLNEAFEQEEAQPRPREMAMDIERETGDNDATFAEMTIDPETGKEDYERGPNDRPEPGENWEKRYRGAVYEDADHMKVTQAARNTLYDLPTVKNNPAVQEYMLQLEDDGTFKADVMHNADSVAEAERVLDAAQKLQGNVDGVLEDILSENTTFDEMSPVQQDTLMMGLDMKLEEGLETGDFSGAAELLEKTNQRQHKIGQLLQALAKYTHTASSAITKATTMISDATEDYVKKHKKGAATNGKLARALETMGNKYADRTTPKQPISHEEMLKRVRNTLEKESASVDELLTDNVVEQITALVESDIPMWQLRDELEHFFNRGEFYTIDESTEQKKARSQKLANALREVTEGKQERVVTEKTVEQIESEIEALLDNEYASIRDEFSDDDISYLANRVKNGAEHAELVDALNQKMATGSMGFTNEELAEVVQLYKEANSGLLTSREEYEAMQKANAILASHMGKGTVMDRLNQWRYLSMLSSPSTHMKNIASNATWSTVTMLKDTLAAGMEAAAEAAGADIERTKSVILPTAKDRALVKEAYDSFDRDVYAEYARGGSKYNDRNEIKQQQKVGSRFVNKASEINSGLLEKEDIFAGRMKYTQALAGYLKANKADASIFSSTDPEDRALLKKAEDYALAEANKATFHEENKLASFLSSASRSTAEGGMIGLNAVVEGLVPFKKTTANIARQFMVEYNPAVQALYGVPKAIYNAVNNGGNVAEVIDNAAKGMTGAGLIALGAYLASQGMLVATGDDDDKDDVLGKAENFAITWLDKEGDQHYYTVDGIAPTAMLMFVGAELFESGFSLDSLTGITDSFIENSLLSGLNNMMEEIAYSNYDKEKSKLFTLLANMANNYISQFFPTVGGKVARSIDATSRSTYTGKKGNTDTVYRYGKKLMNKIPGLSMLNEPRVDTYGNEVENVGGNFFGRLLYNLTSIGYYSKRERDEIQQTIENLDEYAESLEGDARDEMEKQLTDLITAPDKSFGGERLSPEQYTEYSKITGQTAVDVFNGLISNEIFQAMTPEDQAGIMDQMGLFARNLAKREFFGTTSQSYEKLMELYDDRDMDGVMEYLTIKSALDGNTSNAAAVAAVQMSDMSLEDKSYYLSKFITPGKDAQAAIDALGDNGLYYWYSTCSQSTKKEDRYRAIAASGYSDEIKSALTKIVYNSGKDTPADTIPSLDSLLNGTTQDAKGEAIRSESGDEIADQYYSAKDYIKSSADSMGVSTSNTAAQIDGLKQLDVDDETKGYYLETIKGTVSKKALAAGAELGDAGIYYWYTIYTEAQAQYDSSPTKKEVQSVIDASDYPDDVKAALTRANNTKK